MTTETLNGSLKTKWGPVADPCGYLAQLRRLLSRIPVSHTRSYISLLKEIMTLRLGAGRLSFDEYVALRLYDNDIYRAVDKRAFVGLKATKKIWLLANYRVDQFALVNNKLASDILFALQGFPTLPTVALFREHVGRECPFLLRTDLELRAFLTRSEHYPLFGKPVNGFQSIGSASIDHYDEANDRMVTTTGRDISLDAFISFVKTHSASGYLFQKRVSPHAAVREMCGDRLATVRALTIVTEGQPKCISACWKMPAGANAADNFWRPGNLLAQLDYESGRVVRVIRSNGTKHEEISHHPDTGVRILGSTVPNWQEVISLAIEGARVFEEIPLIGWDIAPVDSGAIMVEPNITPDLKLNQLAERRGILDAPFKKFLAERKKHAANMRRQAKRARG